MSTPRTVTFGLNSQLLCYDRVNTSQYKSTPIAERSRPYDAPIPTGDNASISPSNPWSFHLCYPIDIWLISDRSYCSLIIWLFVSMLPSLFHMLFWLKYIFTCRSHLISYLSGLKTAVYKGHLVRLDTAVWISTLISLYFPLLKSLDLFQDHSSQVLGFPVSYQDKT